MDNIQATNKICLSSEYGKFGKAMDKQKTINKIEQAIKIGDTLLALNNSSETVNLVALLMQIRAEIRKVN